MMPFRGRLTVSTVSLVSNSTIRSLLFPGYLYSSRASTILAKAMKGTKTKNIVTATASSEPKVITSISNNLGIIELNNPRALNALDLDMVRIINTTLVGWQRRMRNDSAQDDDGAIRATLVRGRPSSGKVGLRPVFCAGGDVKSVYLSCNSLMDTTSRENEVVGKSGNGGSFVKEEKNGYGIPGLLSSDFFREEYEMNYRIATQPSKSPQISIWDGIVMGGGVGLSIHGAYRIATENTIFAMPETSIGFFPDVGACYTLSRLPIDNSGSDGDGFVGGGMGLYIAMTGRRLTATDVMYAGLATHYVPSSKLEAFSSSLMGIFSNEEEQNSVMKVLSAFETSIDVNQSYLAKNKDAIHEAFGNDLEAVEDIIAKLKAMQQSGNEERCIFARDTLASISKASPRSLKITLKGIRSAASITNIADELKMEYRMAQSCMRDGSDFHEGIRALLVDKDRNPRWNPDEVRNVTSECVDSYFASLGKNDFHAEVIRLESRM